MGLNNGDTISNLGTLNSKKIITTNLNSLYDFWAVSGKLYISNIAYVSIGQGGVLI